MLNETLDAFNSYNGEFSEMVNLFLLFTAIALVPTFLILTTSFTRVLISLSFTRNAMGTQQTPPNQVLIGLALFLSLFIMKPVYTQVTEEAMLPFLEEEITREEAFERGEVPIKEFMLRHTRPQDIELFVETIKEARKNADFVLEYVHWGTEYSYELEEVQLTSGKEYLDAGADAIIGAHSHCLQGMEYYGGKPIIYSLGNYWFNEKTLDTMLLELHFSGNDLESQLDVKVIPAIQEDYKTTFVSDKEERERIFSFLEGISINVSIDENGILKEIIEVAE